MSTSRVAASLTVSVILLGTLDRVAHAQVALDTVKLEAVARSELQATSTPGAAVVVIHGGRVIFMRAFGLTSRENGVPVTPITLFYGGGLSRLFIAATLLSLAKDGKLDLDVPIRHYVTGLSPKISGITGHQLLASTGGLKEEHIQIGIIGDSALRELTHSWGDDRVFTEPGRIFSGSHLSYTLAGVLIEAVSGKSFADVVHERVFVPLGMSGATYRPLIAVTHSFSQGHQRASTGEMEVVRPFADNSVGLPRDSFYGIADAARFLTALVNGGQVEGRQALPPDVVEKLLRSYTASPAADDEFEGYGVHVSQRAGMRLLIIGTSWAGFTATVRIVPEQQFAVMTIANGSVHLRRTVEEALRGILSASPTRTQPTPRAIRRDQAARYAGVYENERVLRLFTRGDQLLIRDESPNRSLGSVTDGDAWPVAKLGARDFIATRPGTSEVLRFRFVYGPDERIEYLVFGGRALIKR